MTDDSARQGDGEVARRRRLSPVVFVALGAIVGIAGAGLAIPSGSDRAAGAAPTPGVLDVEHPTLLEFRFNPRLQVGEPSARAAFRFAYQVRADLDHEALELVRANWDRARSNVLLLLRARTAAELAGAHSREMLAKDLVAELDAVLFPGGRDQKVASVTAVRWQQLAVD